MNTTLIGWIVSIAGMSMLYGCWPLAAGGRVRRALAFTAAATVAAGTTLEVADARALAYIASLVTFAILVARALHGSRCWHHDVGTGDTWVKGQLIDTGMRKMLWCTKCDRTWFI